MIREHVAAVKALLTAVLADAVYDGEAPSAADPTTPERYVVLWPDNGDPQAEHLCGTSSTVTMLIQTTAVGKTADQARWVADKVFPALLDVRPTVAGRVCDPIRHDTAQPIRRDDDAGGWFYAVDVWRLVTRPA